MSKTNQRFPEWEIKSRSHICSHTGKPFEEKEVIWTLLHIEGDVLRREDLCEAAWETMRKKEETRIFSFWKSRYEPPPSPEPEALGKENAEQMLRRLMEELSPGHANTCYILALMLERKRTLRQIETKSDAQGRILIYEHVKTGEVLLIRDPNLRLDQIEEVQREVYSALGTADGVAVT